MALITVKAASRVRIVARTLTLEVVRIIRIGRASINQFVLLIMKRSVVCGEDKIVAVHHYDHNHENNDPKNLIPLCPTHHAYVHSRYANEVLPYIEKYKLGVG